jgi:hypothetical protein
MLELRVSDPADVRRARMAQYRNRSGSVCLNGNTIFGSVVSVMPDAIDREICVVKFLPVPQRRDSPRVRPKVRY